MKDDADESPAFVDTNVFVYAITGDDPVRSSLAEELVRELMLRRRMRTSTQVLQELYVTLTRKGATPLSPAQAVRYIDQIAAWPVTTTDFRSIRRAIDLSVDSMLSFWDALILVAASNCGARTLFSEDLQAGRKLLGVEVVNPFQSTKK